jgi:hypothetical protein
MAKTKSPYRIVPVKVTEYEVRDITGKRIKRFKDRKTANAWVSGCIAMANSIRQRMEQDSE